MVEKIKCGGCERLFYPPDLFSHFTSSHLNQFEHLREEAAKAWVNNQSDKCSIVVAGVPCGKPAVALPVVRIFTLDRHTRLHNPTQGPNVNLDFPQKLCEDHMKNISALDLIGAQDRQEQLEAVLAGQREHRTPAGVVQVYPDGLCIDWKRLNSYGERGPELIFFPLVPMEPLS